jgi:hypothetical protein
MKRHKMISLRLSDAEYEAFRKLHRSYGAQNVSDFARLAMQRIIVGSPEDADQLALKFVLKLQALDDRLQTIEGLDVNVAMKVHEFHNRIEALETRLAGLLAVETRTP